MANRSATPADEGTAAAKVDAFNATAARIELMSRAVDEMQTLPTDVLLAMAKSDTFTREVLHNLLTGRGVGCDGQWIGYGCAKSFWKTAYFTPSGFMTVPEDE